MAPEPQGEKHRLQYEVAEPTLQLRFVVRRTQTPDMGGEVIMHKSERILQQLWEIKLYAVSDGRPTGISHEWRDVPLQEET